MNAADIRNSVSSFYNDIWNRHDESAMASLLTTEFTFRGSLGRTCQGHSEFAKYVNMVHQALGSYRCEILDVVCSHILGRVLQSPGGLSRRYDGRSGLITSNPWLKLPLADYEGHMTLPAVGKAALLADLFEQALRNHRPQSVAMFGCAGGNGFERIDPDCTERVVGVDVNPEYIQTTRERFAVSLPGLELHVADVSDQDWTIAPVDLIFAGLLLEYVELGSVVAAIRRSLNPGGVWVAVIQLPSPVQPFLSSTPFHSLQEIAAAA